MAFDPVPWAIGGGAEMSDEVARLAANIFTKDAQGIALPGDLRVRALNSPAAAVTIDDGGVIIRNAQAPGQSYIGRVASLTQVPVAPNNSSSPRSDLIIARVKDPDYSPWQPYTDPLQIAYGPYFEPWVIPGVSSAVTLAEQVVSYSAEALARIDLPAGAQTVTEGMIKPLRRLYAPRQWVESEAQACISGTVTEAQTDWVRFPDNTVATFVPPWATHALVKWTFTTLAVSGSAEMNTRLRLGNLVGDLVSYFDYIRPVQFSGDVVDNRAHVTAQLFDVRSLRGQTVLVQHDGKRVGTDHTDANVFVTPADKMVVDILYSERVV